MDHLAEQRVLDLVRGALAEPIAIDAHEHLDRCEECRAVVAIVLRSPALAGVAAASPAATAATPTDATEPALGVGSEDPASSPTHADGPLARAHGRLPVTRLEEYELRALVGRGGMGSVYRARDTLLERDVAIKLMARTGSAHARERFLVEARAVARIRHPNVVVVHRVGVTDDQPYIVYDLIAGRALDELATPMPYGKVLELAVGIARGLAAAHACGVLHRDLKPANVMLEERGDIVLVDFGLAKLDGEDVPGTPAGPARDLRMTATGVAMGTPRYMAPEAWRGQPATAQTDLYSFGLVLHELLAGRLPFAEPDATALAHAVCETDPPPLAQHAPWVPHPLAALVDACIARDPARRPASAAALVAALEGLQRGRAFETFERERVRRAPAGNPYVGARPFGFEHQGVFFGRSAELRALVDVLRARPFVVIAGEAGVGKTSLGMAGLLPILARGALGGARRWVPVPITPGAHPLAALAAALAPHVERDPAAMARALVDDTDAVIAEVRAGHRGCSAHVLFVDPLDDLLAAERAEAAQFATVLAKLAEPSPAVRVIATVRAANLMAIAQLPGLAAAIGPALYLLLEPRDPAALREIVVEPARLSGRTLADADALVEAGARGALPLAALAQRLRAAWDAA